MLEHLVNNCSLVNLICDDCEQRCRRVDYGNHNCLPALKNLTREQKQKIAEKDAVIVALEETKDNIERQIAEKLALLVQRDASITQ
jgi:hypothetical protein